MNQNVGISLNMNPRWVGEDGLNGFLNPLRQVGLNTLEFELDAFLPEWNEIPHLIEDCHNAGMKLCFHAAYRNPNRIEGFSRNQRDAIVNQFQPMLSIAQGWAEKTKFPVNVVFHGAHSMDQKRDILEKDTIEFLAWVLDSFPGIFPALENNHPSKVGEIKIEGSRSSVFNVIEEINNPRLGVCWDMGHDFLSQGGMAVDQDWLSHVNHVHIHDVNNEGIDHYPLIFGNVPFAAWLPLLRSAKDLRVVTLELKGGLMTGWEWDRIQSALIDSIRIIQQGLGQK